MEQADKDIALFDVMVVDDGYRRWKQKLSEDSHLCFFIRVVNSALLPAIAASIYHNSLPIFPSLPE